MLGSSFGRARRAVPWMCAALLLLGCKDEGDDEGGGACDTAACGGDVQGEWQISQLCEWEAVGDMFADTGCANAKANTSGLQMSGPVSFTAGGNYTSSMTLKGSMTITMPTECLTDPDSGITLTCSQLNMAIQQVLDDPEAPFSAFSCSGSSSCTCTATMKPIEATESGTYSTSGNKLTMTPEGDVATTNDYCVSGNTLTVHGDAEEPSIVLTKK